MYRPNNVGPKFTKDIRNHKKKTNGIRDKIYIQFVFLHQN